MNREELKIHNTSVIDAYKNALAGIFYALKTQINIRKQLLIGVLAIIAGIILKINALEWIALTFSITLVIFAEMVNTAVETTVDLITHKFSAKAKRAKDVAAGAVLITSLNAVIVGFILFLPKII